MYKASQKRLKRPNPRHSPNHPFYGTSRVLIAASKHPKVTDVPSEKSSVEIVEAEAQGED